MRRVCATCSVAVEAAAPAADTGETDNVCTTCGAGLRAPTAFDCARLGLQPELQAIVEADPAFDVNALEEATDATLLHHAAINSKMRVLEYIFSEPKLRARVDVDALGGEMRTTPLFWAAFHNHIYAVELLLRHGADPGFADALGSNPFLLAIQRCFPITAAYLVAKGTDVDVRVKDKQRKTALMLLCHRQKFHLDSFRMVLSLHADVDAQDADGNTALHHAVLNNLTLPVRMLLDRDADPNVKNADGDTPRDLARKTLSPDAPARVLLTEDWQLQELARTTSIPKRTLEDNVYKLSFLVPWAFLPLCAWILATTSGLWMILLKEGVLLAAAFSLVKLLQRGSYGDKRKAAALMFGVNVASIGWLVASFAWFSPGNCSRGFYATMSTAVFLMCFTLYKTAVADPGVVSTTYEEKIHNIVSLVESKLPSPTKLCLTCLHKRPLRAKHCAETNTCIAKFDHYCPFVNNAVGAGNHHYFLGFLLFAVVSIGMALAANWRYLARQEDVLWTSGVFSWAWSVVHFHPVLFCASVLDAIHIAWIGYMLLFHVYLALAALTTNEVVKGENLDRAYSRGVLLNAVDFLHLPGKKTVDWRRVFNMDEYNQAGGPKSKHM